MKIMQRSLVGIKGRISEILKTDAKIEIIVPEKETDYDAAFCCASVAKQMKKNPVELAEKIAKEFDKGKIIERAEQKGIYVNFYFDRQKQSKNIVKEALEPEKKKKLRKTILIEYPGVNPGKPLHIGHCRNAVLGASIARIFEFCGTGVLRTDYIDDMGLQAACITWGLLNMNKSELPLKKGYAVKTDQWQGRIYANVAKQMKENKKTEEAVRQLMKRIEEREDKELIKKHDSFVEECILAQYQTQWRLGIFHDLKIHESHLIDTKIYDRTFKIIKKSKNVVYESEGKNKGCLVAKLGNMEEYKKMTNPDKILVRSDGTSTYTAKDISFHFWKFSLIDATEAVYKRWVKQPNGEEMHSVDLKGSAKKEFNIKKEKVINVIGSEQRYTQQAMYDILKLCGYQKEYDNSIHIAYEHVWFREKGENFKFSGRSGNWIGYSTDEVMDRAVGIALEGVKERQKGKTEKWKKNTAELLGTSAVKFTMLKNSWTKKIAFDWGKIMDMHGDTACYLQYSYARARGILRKANIDENDISRELKTSVFGNKEYYILKRISMFPLVAQKAREEYAPNVIANYCLEIAGIFNSFYASSPVLDAEEKTKNARLLLVLAFSKSLKKALSLLLIDCAEEI